MTMTPEKIEELCRCLKERTHLFAPINIRTENDAAIDAMRDLALSALRQEAQPVAEAVDSREPDTFCVWHGPYFSTGVKSCPQCALAEKDEARDALRLVYACSGKFDYQAFASHVLRVGGTGDIHDCRTYIDAALAPDAGKETK